VVLFFYVFFKLTSLILTGMLVLLVFILASDMAPVPDTVDLTKMIFFALCLKCRKC